MKIYWFFGILLYNTVHSYQNMPVRNTYLESLKKSRSRQVMITESQNFNRTIIPVSMSVQAMIQKTNNRKKSSSDGTFTIENLDANYNLSSIGGYKDVKDELIQVIDFLMNTTSYSMYNVRTPKGILLEGPPGNGKTLLAKALAGEINASFIATAGPVFNERYVGVGAGRVRELFEFAKNNKPCVIFIDEIDAVAKKRSGNGEGSESERDQTLNQLLICMDGFASSSDSILIIGATNRVDMLDKAILRPGRFDKIIHVPNPDKETRSEILNIHKINKPINVTHEELIKLTNGFSGAQIENLLNEATLYALRNNSIPVTLETLNIIKERFIMGYSTRKKFMSNIALKRIAVHEVGHLLVCLSSIYLEKPKKVSIESTSPNNLGFTLLDDSNENEDPIYTREYFEDKLKVLLGGRIAEEIIYGTSVSSGALSDLEQAFTLAKTMIINYGMGNKIIYPYFSEQYKKEIDDEIHLLIHNAYRDAKKILEINKNVMNRIVDVLLVKKSLLYNEILEIILPSTNE